MYKTKVEKCSRYTVVSDGTWTGGKMSSIPQMLMGVLADFVVVCPNSATSPAPSPPPPSFYRHACICILWQHPPTTLPLINGFPAILKYNILRMVPSVKQTLILTMANKLLRSTDSIQSFGEKIISD